MTTLDFLKKKLNMDVSKKITFFDENDKKTVKTQYGEVLRFDNGLFTVERRNSYV